jgi:hypothetical protein
MAGTARADPAELILQWQTAFDDPESLGSRGIVGVNVIQQRGIRQAGKLVIEHGRPIRGTQIIFEEELITAAGG